MASPTQNVVPLKDGRALVDVALDGASPCLTSYASAAALSRPAVDAERSPGEMKRARDDGHVMPVAFDGHPTGVTALVLLGRGDPEHEAEWMGRVAWRLKVPRWFLGIGAGWHLLEKPDGYDRGNDPYFKYLAVPPSFGILARLQPPKQGLATTA